LFRRRLRGAQADKGHGTERKIGGNFKPDSTVILFDDVTTKGDLMLRSRATARRLEA